jgi:hypothetical protein
MSPRSSARRRLKKGSLSFSATKPLNDRAFHRALADLLKLRAEKRRSEIGFESLQQKKAQETRREAAEKRRQELHRWAVLLAEAKVVHQQVLTLNLEMDRTQATIPQNERMEVKTNAQASGAVVRDSKKAA